MMQLRNPAVRPHAMPICRPPSSPCPATGPPVSPLVQRQLFTPQPPPLLPVPLWPAGPSTSPPEGQEVDQQLDEAGITLLTGLAGLKRSWPDGGSEGEEQQQQQQQQQQAPALTAAAEWLSNEAASAPAGASGGEDAGAVRGESS